MSRRNIIGHKVGQDYRVGIDPVKRHRSRFPALFDIVASLVIMGSTLLATMLILCMEG